MTPQKAAWYTTTEAIRKGELVRPETCDRCAVGGRIEAHHDDYGNPLDVRWLCRKCHRARHRDVRVDLVNRDSVLTALLKSGGSVTQAAVELGVHRVTIHKWMREYGIEVQRIVA